MPHCKLLDGNSYAKPQNQYGSDRVEEGLQSVGSFLGTKKQAGI